MITTLENAKRKRNYEFANQTGEESIVNYKSLTNNSVNAQSTFNSKINGASLESKYEKLLKLQKQKKCDLGIALGLEILNQTHYHLGTFQVLSNLYKEKNDPGNAFKYAKLAFGLDNKDLTSLTLMGEAYYLKDDKVNAIKYWDQVYNSSSVSFESLYSIGKHLLLLGYYKKSIIFFKKAILINPSCRKSLFYMFQAWSELGDYPAALHYLGKGLESIPDNGPRKRVANSIFNVARREIERNERLW